ncbi:MAG: polyamine aminopropyltransferase [Candidatus Aureabacteria bacterium]|nr:polyamine aminopropyltransferase [Candidatus Auribacterota bacterium]
MPKWIYETLYPDLKQGFKVKKVLYKSRTEFQDMELVETSRFGRVLVLDGVVQTTEKDEFIYHEMLTHVPLLTHGNPKKILLIGAGDGGILRETLKHPVDEVVMVEIDRAVVDFSKKYLRPICKNAFSDKRLKLVIDDGAKFVKKTDEKFDVVIIDSTDPVGPAKCLFTLGFFKGVSRILLTKGIMARQTGSPWLQSGEFRNSCRKSETAFKYYEPYMMATPTYYGGFFSLIIASDGINLSRGKTDFNRIEKKYKKLKLNTKYYNPEVHYGAFCLPGYVNEIRRKRKK